MKIGFRHIEIFHAIMLAGSLTEASRQLRTSQPTISRELSAFEKELGFMLFERRARRLIATEQAIQFHAEVTRAYHGLHHLKEVARAIHDNVTSHISIACLPLFAETVMPRVCKKMIAQDPNVHVTFHSVDNAELTRDLLALRYELGIVEVGVAAADVFIQKYEIGNEVCIVPVGHSLAKLECIHPKDLQGHSFITFPSGDRYRNRFDQLFAEAGLSRSIRIETNTAEAVCALVEQGVGLALVNPISAWAWRARGIEIRRFSVPIPFIVGICQPLGRPNSRLAAQVAKLVIDECKLFRNDLQT